MGVRKPHRYDYVGEGIKIGPLHTITAEGKVFSHYTGKYLRQTIGTNGRYGVTLRTFADDRLVRREVHVLVCTAFYGARPSNEFEASHLNGNRLDNSRDNLIWEHRKDNVGRQVEHGTRLEGVSVPWSKLAAEDVEYIRRNTEAMTQRELATMFNVTQPTIHKVITGKRYKEIK